MKLIVSTAWVFALPMLVMAHSTSAYDKSALFSIAVYGALTYAAGWIASRWSRREA